MAKFENQFKQKNFFFGMTQVTREKGGGGLGCRGLMIEVGISENMCENKNL